MIKWSINMVNEDAEKLIIEIISQIKCIKFYSKWWIQFILKTYI